MTRPGPGPRTDRGSLGRRARRVSRRVSRLTPRLAPPVRDDRGDDGVARARVRGSRVRSRGGLGAVGIGRFRRGGRPERRPPAFEGRVSSRIERGRVHARPTRRGRRGHDATRREHPRDHLTGDLLGVGRARRGEGYDERNVRGARSLPPPVRPRGELRPGREHPGRHRQSEGAPGRTHVPGPSRERRRRTRTGGRGTREARPPGRIAPSAPPDRARSPSLVTRDRPRRRLARVLTVRRAPPNIHHRRLAPTRHRTRGGGRRGVRGRARRRCRRRRRRRRRDDGPVPPRR